MAKNENPSNTKGSAPCEELKLFTTDEVAEIVHCNPETIRRKCRAGLIPAKKWGREWRISRSLIEFLVQNGLPQEAKAPTPVTDTISGKILNLSCVIVICLNIISGPSVGIILRGRDDYRRHTRRRRLRKNNLCCNALFASVLCRPPFVLSMQADAYKCGSRQNCGQGFGHDFRRNTFL